MTEPQGIPVMKTETLSLSRGRSVWASSIPGRPRCISGSDSISHLPGTARLVLKRIPSLSVMARKSILAGVH